MHRLLILLILSPLLFTSCEDNMVLRSEKKMKQELQGKWQREFLGVQPYVKYCSSTTDSVPFNEFWIFQGDYYYRVFELESSVFCDFGADDQTLSDLVDTLTISKFKIDARLTRAYLKFQLIDRGVDSTAFVDRWEFVELEDGVLYLATDDPVSNTVLQREFFKVK